MNPQHAKVIERIFRRLPRNTWANADSVFSMLQDELQPILEAGQAMRDNGSRVDLLAAWDKAVEG